MVNEPVQQGPDPEVLQGNADSGYSVMQCFFFTSSWASRKKLESRLKF